MQQVQDMLEFNIDTPSDAQLKEEFSKIEQSQDNVQSLGRLMRDTNRVDDSRVSVKYLSKNQAKRQRQKLRSQGVIS